MSTTETISSPRLILTPLDVADASEMAAVLADEQLYRYTGGHPPTIADLEARYRHQVAGSPRPLETWHNWVVRLEGAAVGFVQATVTPAGADLAWVIGSRWQRRGFGREAASAMLQWLHGTGVDRFTAHIHPDHGASAGVATAIGMAQTDTVDEDGEVLWLLDLRPYEDASPRELPT